MKLASVIWILLAMFIWGRGGRYLRLIDTLVKILSLDMRVCTARQSPVSSFHLGYVLNLLMMIATQ